MNRRPLFVMALLAASGFTSSGCLSTPPGLPPLSMSSTSQSSPESENTAELPAKASGQVNLKLAENFEKSGHLAEALVYFDRARQADSRLPGIAKRMAILHDRLGNTDQAYAEFQAALKASPNDPEVLNGLGYFHYSRGQWDNAEKHLRQAVQADPQYRKAWVNLGMTLCQLQRYEEGLAAFSKAVSQAEAHSNVAFILTVQKRFTEAKAEYRQALACNPNLTIARLALAKLERPETSAGGSTQVLAPNR